MGQITGLNTQIRFEAENLKLNAVIEQLKAIANKARANVDLLALENPIMMAPQNENANNRVKITVECIKKSGVFGTRYAKGTVGELIEITRDERYVIKGDTFKGIANPKNWRIKEV